ncbi:MAG: YraN family protein [Deltaproteobacteria bacterium]|nr:YraN family protein [Deltaproteobacteria bacterium]
MAHDRQMLGQSGEEIAADYLQSIGFRIVERNFRTRRGEIDLIASRGRAFHFIEVKTSPRANSAGSSRRPLHTAPAIGVLMPRSISMS